MARANDTALRIMLDPELKGLRELKTGLVKAVTDSTTVFSKKIALGLKDKLQKQFKEAEKANLKAAAIAHTLATKNLSAQARQSLDLKLKQYRLEAAAATKRFKDELKQEGKRIAVRKAGFEKVAESQALTKAAGEMGAKFGDEVQGAFDDLISKDIPKMFSGVLGRLGSLSQKAGMGLMRKAPEGSMMGGLGKALAKMGPTLIAIASMAAGFAAVFKILVDIDGQAKSLNRALINGGTSAASLADEFGSVEESLNAIRKSTTEFGFNRVWGTTAEDLHQIIGAYETAGTTFQELTRHVSGTRSETEKLKEALSITMTYAKLFNLESSDMAGNASSYMEELGLGFEGVQKALSGVYQSAKDSGFGVKRFYGMLLQATSGMTMYNVRLNEAAGLLVSLGKILGSEMGGNFLQQLTKGFGDKSMTDKYKHVKMTGGGKMEGIFDRSAGATAADFQGKVKGLGAGSAQSAFESTFQKFTNKSVLGMTPDEMVNALGSMSPEKQADMLADARKSGNHDLVRQLTNLMQVSVGAKGGTGNMARSLGGLDMGGKLAAMLSQTAGVMATPLYKMSDTQLMAFESMTGISGEQLEQLRRIDATMHGNWNSLKDLQKGAGAGYDETEIRRQITAYGAYIKMDEKGVAQVVAASIDDKTGAITDGQTLKNVGDLIQGSGEIFKEAAKDQLSADTRLAQDMVANTTELTKVMEQGVQWWLEQIHGVVETIANFLGGGSEKEARAQALATLSESLKKYQVELKDLNKEAGQIKADLATETDSGARDVLRGALAEIEGKISQRRGAMDVVATEKANLLRTPAGNGSRTSRQFLAASRDPEVQARLNEQASGVVSDSTRKQMEARFIEETTARILAGGVSAGLVPGDSEFQGDALRQFLSRIAPDVVSARLTGAAPVVPGDATESIVGDGYGKRLTVTDKMLSVMQDMAEKLNFDDYMAEGKRQAAIQKDAEKKALLDTAVQKKNQETFEKAIKAGREGQLAEEMQAILAATGRKTSVEEARGLIQVLRNGGDLPADVQASLGKNVTLPGGRVGTAEQALLDRGIPVRSKANDLVMQIGANGVKFAQRVDSGDVGVFSKAGGALSKAGGSGSGVNVFHLYGEGPGVLNTITKAQSAGLLR